MSKVFPQASEFLLPCDGEGLELAFGTSLGIFIDRAKRVALVNSDYAVAARQALTSLAVEFELLGRVSQTHQRLHILPSVLGHHSKLLAAFRVWGVDRYDSVVPAVLHTLVCVRTEIAEVGLAIATVSHRGVCAVALPANDGVLFVLRTLGCVIRIVSEGEVGQEFSRSALWYLVLPSALRNVWQHGSTFGSLKTSPQELQVCVLS